MKNGRGDVRNESKLPLSRQIEHDESVKSVQNNTNSSENSELRLILTILLGLFVGCIISLLHTIRPIYVIITLLLHYVIITLLGLLVLLLLQIVIFVSLDLFLYHNSTDATIQIIIYLL